MLIALTTACVLVATATYDQWGYRYSELSFSTQLSYDPKPVFMVTRRERWPLLPGSDLVRTEIPADVYIDYMRAYEFRTHRTVRESGLSRSQVSVFK